MKYLTILWIYFTCLFASRREDDNERFSVIEQTLLELKDEQKAAKQKTEENQAKLNDMREELIKATKKITDLESSQQRLKEPPYHHSCSSIELVKLTQSVVTYQKLLYNSTNVNLGGMDLNTGLFTSGWPGSYQVTWSFESLNDPG